MLRNVPGWAVSILVHVAILAVFATIPMAANHQQVLVALETFFKDEERPPEEFQKEFDNSNTIAETFNVIAGGAVSATGAVGGSATAAQSATKKIDESAEVRDPDLNVNVGDVEIPGVDTFSRDLGMEKITGEVGAVVEGYGAALDRLTQELLREMRGEKICAVWMFDESESMKDDQAEIKKRINRVYQELNLVSAQETEKHQKLGETALVNAIVSFGAQVHYQTPKGKVTDKIPELVKAIDQIPNDPTGAENTFAAVTQVVNDFRPYFTRAKRKLVVILISDESGDDGQNIDDAIAVCRKAQASVYVLGRESVFGYLYAYIAWTEPTYKDTHWLPVRRGPETPFAELLQFDGFQARTDASMSGFGPYEQSRLARDTGGIFFMLPGEDQNVINHDQRKYQALDLKPYTPDIGARREYAENRDRNPFRKAVWETIALLDPHVKGNEGVQVPLHAYSLAKGQYETAVQNTLARCGHTWELLNQAEARLTAVAPLRAKEDSRRWRANYDLMVAQMKAYKVRLFQYAAGLEHFATELPRMKHDLKANVWGVGHGSAQLLKPSPDQEKKYKVKLEDITKARDLALREFDKVIGEHPNTPWANKANWEKSRGFGASYGEWFQPPPPVRKPTDPKPQPVPKL